MNRRYQGRHSKNKRWPGLVRFIVITSLVILLIWPAVEPYQVSLDEKKLTISDLPESIGQLRIVYATDLHQGTWPFFSKSRCDALITQINNLNADIVILGGDYAFDPDGAVAFFKGMDRINAKYGVYAVAGDADRSIENGEARLKALRTATKNAGITLLVNEAASFRYGNYTIYIAGIDDSENGTPQISSVASSVRNEDFVILAAHNPSLIDKALSTNGGRWFDLGLFGHTHGGQLAFFGNLLPFSSASGSHKTGWSVENRINMLISKGIGTSIIPLRFLRTPQFHLITVNSGR